jgi:ferritin
MGYSLISMTLCSAICEQIGHEKYNANLYLFICGFLRNKGFDNLSKHFEQQHEEETGHSLEFFNLLTDLGAPIMIPEIDAIDIKFNSIVDIAQAYVDREILTTTSIEELKQMAISEKNSVVEEMMREMIKIQQAEYQESTTFFDNAELCGSDWYKVKVWNDSTEIED